MDGKKKTENIFGIGNYGKKFGKIPKKLIYEFVGLKAMRKMNLITVVM